MSAFLSPRLGLLIVVSAFSFIATAQTLEGRLGSAAGPGWQSSWLGLAEDVSFKKGERLIIQLDGDAEYVVVRLLAANSDPDSPEGIEGTSRTVPANRLLVVTLSRDRPAVEQVSVHAGAAAWDIALSQNNGKALIVSVERDVKRSAKPAVRPTD
ncbi:MAG: hypothetical protein OEL91_09125 [Burkholderiaceae bacterium]|nr:hypothetical protein [Burkholderiaceae bacterium]